MQRRTLARRGRSPVTLTMLACITALVVSMLTVFSSPADAVVTLKQGASVTQDVAGAAKNNGRVSLGAFDVKPGTVPLGKNFGGWLLDKAGGAVASQGVGMIFSLLGLSDLFGSPDPNTALLKEIKQQLTQVQGQITDLQTGLNGTIGLLDRDALDSKLISLRENVTNPLDNLYRYEFTNVVDAAEVLAKAKQGTDQAKIDKATDALIGRRNEFYVAFDGCCKTAPKNIHDFLVPGQATSVLGSLGRLQLNRDRYLTAVQSAQIRGLYDQFADWEALAAWMKMERNLPAIDADRVPSGTFPGSQASYNTARREFLGFRVSEARNLPPAIPAGVVIDAGSSVPRPGTSNTAMWIPVSGSLRFEPGVGGLGTVPGAQVDLNARYAEGFNDWQVPSQAGLTSLLGGLAAAPAKTPGDFLSALNPASPAWQQIAKNAWPFIWSNDLVTQKTGCMPTVNGSRDLHHSVVTHTGVSIATSTATWSGRPQIPRESPTMVSDRSNICTIWVRAQFASPGAVGGFLASRSTGVMPIDYMAQGAGPNLRPGANLRAANLAGLDLTGVDLTGADLTDATLTGAHFTDDQGATGLNLAGAKLAGVSSGGIIGTGTLPAPWRLVNGYLVGPGANLTGADLSDADLRGATLTGVTSGGVDCTGCTLPTGWHWTGLEKNGGGGYLVGPGANLPGADLSGADLSGVDFTSADLHGANLSDAVLTHALFSRNDLTNADFRGSDLTNAEIGRSTVSAADFSGAVLTGLRAYSLTYNPLPKLPEGWLGLYGYLLGPGANLTNRYWGGDNLSGANLAGARLDRSNFDSTNLTGVNLAGADFTGSNLVNANLTGANLTGANLTSADLTSANLTNATLVNARLTNATVRNATFSTDSDNKFAGIVSGGLVDTPKSLPASGRYRLVQGYLVGPSANLAGASFTSAAQLGASLSGTNFTGATLSGVNLTGATLRNAIFSGARLTGATLSGADMSNATLDGVRSDGIVGLPSLPAGWKVLTGYLVGPGADLSDANLRGANLAYLNLSAANLSRANLTSALLLGANLEGAELKGAVLTDIKWAFTTCPDGTRGNTTPCGPVAWLGSSTVSASVNNADGTLLVDVGPNLSGGAEWRVTVQTLTESGGWRAVSVHPTKGAGDTLKLNLPGGTYRAVVPPQNSYRASTSPAVVLAK